MIKKPSFRGEEKVFYSKKASYINITKIYYIKEGELEKYVDFDNVHYTHYLDSYLVMIILKI
ncbi:unknown; predicted coding region [Mycoplasmopsis pulmonis]|uniref:Uncharacterized protein n=1 Tax=Mycoplasmopsis pulmonis (strain UAB CTIP) TaxID=272635 RepID=Q98RD8_MYCPU|nr:unknown; predicted coding region [Mycoplasmopsis pulmonis]